MVIACECTKDKTICSYACNNIMQLLQQDHGLIINYMYICTNIHT